MPSIQDPYTLVYDLLLNIIKQSKGVRLVVADLEGKLISFNTIQGHAAAKLQGEASTPKLPDIQLASGNVGGNLNFASNAIQLNRLYQYLISTDTGAIGETIYPLEWAITCAMVDAQYESQLRELAWNGYKFIKNVQLASTTSGESNEEANRGIQGWAAVWQLNIQMLFPQSMLRQFNQGIEIVAVPL